MALCRRCRSTFVGSRLGRTRSAASSVTKALPVFSGTDTGRKSLSQARPLIGGDFFTSSTHSCERQYQKSAPLGTTRIPRSCFSDKHEPVSALYQGASLDRAGSAPCSYFGDRVLCVGR